MKNTLLVLAMICAIFAIASCGSKDAEYYLSHPEEMKRRWGECSNLSDAERRLDRECSAINQANMKKQFDMGSARPNPLAGKGNNRERPRF